MNTSRKYLSMCAERAISKSEIDISIPNWGGYRPDYYQHEMFLKKWSKVDGYQKKSMHQMTDEDGKCLALDLCAYVDGEQNWDKERLIYIHMLMVESWHELQQEGKIPKDRYLWWGGFWKDSWDKPHYYDKNYQQKF